MVSGSSMLRSVRLSNLARISDRHAIKKPTLTHNSPNPIKLGEMMKKYVDLGEFLSRYLRSKRKQKSSLLNELCDLYGYNRKYLLQYFNHLTGRKHIRRGAKRCYTEKELLGPLTQIWLATDQICSHALLATCL